MTWTMITKQGDFVTQTSGQAPDPVKAIADRAAHFKSLGQPTATVGTKISHWGDGLSVNFSISVECPQTQPDLEYAAQVLFYTATRFVNEAMYRFDPNLPLLPTG